jgi:FlaA1/EpsC-like NDP-sugar epimerase
MLSILMTDKQAGLLLFGLLVAGFVGIARLGYEEFALVRSGLVLRFYEAPTFRRSFLVVFVDLSISAVAVYAAIGLRTDDWRLVASRDLWVELFALTSATTPVALWLLGLYRGAWRLVGVYDVRRLVIGLVAANAVSYLLVEQVFQQPRAAPVLAICFMCQVILAVGARTSYKFFVDIQWRARANGEKVVICGAGPGGLVTLRELLSNMSVKLKPVGFIDENPRMIGRTIQGFPVVGTVLGCEEALKRLAVAAVVLSTDEISAEHVRQLGAICTSLGIRLLQMTVKIDDISTSRPAIKVVRNGPVLIEESAAIIGGE